MPKRRYRGRSYLTVDSQQQRCPNALSCSCGWLVDHALSGPPKGSAAIRDDLRSSHPQVQGLSMGMSLDYSVAVEEGATMDRIGTA